MAARLFAPPPFAGASAAGRAAVRHARRLSRRRTGRCAASRRRSTRPTKTSTSTGATSSCCRRRRSTWSAAVRPKPTRRCCSARSPAIRFPTRRRSSSPRMSRALSLGLDDADRHRGAVRGAAQGGRDPARDRAGRAAGADAVVHAAEGRAALRPVQQVPGAKGCVQRGRRRRSDGVSQTIADSRRPNYEVRTPSDLLVLGLGPS